MKTIAVLGGGNVGRALAQDRVARHGDAIPEPIVRLGGGLERAVQQQFEAWSRLERVKPLDERNASEVLARELERHLDATGDTDGLDDEVLHDTYAMMGCARAVTQATARLGVAVNSLDWDQWAEARF